MYSIADSLRDEGIEIGKEEGLKQGLEQGLEQGRVQELRRVLVRQLEKRFGLTNDDRAIVADCTDIENLEAAAERLVEPEATKDTVLGPAGCQGRCRVDFLSDYADFRLG